MISPLPRKMILALGLLASATLASSAASSGDLVPVADRCAIYGQGFVDIGNGTCGRVQDLRSWHGGSASNAGLRTDGLGMLPGAGNARHLRIQADPDFR